MDDVIAGVAAHGLASAADDEWATVLAEAGTGDWGRVVAACEEHRLLGVLASAVCDGAVRLDSGQHATLESRYRHWLAHDLVVEDVMLRALARLNGAGVRAWVLKGIALAHTVYRDPSLRVFADADLLIEPGKFSEAVSLLTGDFGAERVVPELRAGFDERFGREATLRVGPVELDLHRTLVDGPFGLWIPLAELVEHPVEFRIGGTAVAGLGPTQQFVHCCLSAVLGDWPPRLVVLRDIAELLVGGPGRPPVDAGAVRSMAARWRAEPAVALAIRRAADDLGLDSDHPLIVWARSYRPGPLARLVLASYRGRARGYTSQALSVLAISGWRNRWDYVRAVVRPSRDYLEARGFRRGDRLRRALGRGPR